jgi:hypothetical protein
VDEEAARRQVHAWVSEEALTGWHEFTLAHNTNIAALLEAIGIRLLTVAETPDTRLTPFLRDCVVDAQRVAGRRSARRRQEPV